MRPFFLYGMIFSCLSAIAEPPSYAVTKLTVEEKSQINTMFDFFCKELLAYFSQKFPEKSWNISHVIEYLDQNNDASFAKELYNHLVLKAKDRFSYPKETDKEIDLATIGLTFLRNMKLKNINDLAENDLTAKTNELLVEINDICKEWMIKGASSASDHPQDPVQTVQAQQKNQNQEHTFQVKQEEGISFITEPTSIQHFYQSLTKEVFDFLNKNIFSNRLTNIAFEAKVVAALTNPENKPHREKLHQILVEKFPTDTSQTITFICQNFLYRLGIRDDLQEDLFKCHKDAIQYFKNNPKCSLEAFFKHNQVTGKKARALYQIHDILNQTLRLDHLLNTNQDTKEVLQKLFHVNNVEPKMLNTAQDSSLQDSASMQNLMEADQSVSPQKEFTQKEPMSKQSILIKNKEQKAPKKVHFKESFDEESDLIEDEQSGTYHNDILKLNGLALEQLKRQFPEEEFTLLDLQNNVQRLDIKKFFQNIKPLRAMQKLSEKKDDILYLREDVIRCWKRVHFLPREKQVTQRMDDIAKAQEFLENKKYFQSKKGLDIIKNSIASDHKILAELRTKLKRPIHLMVEAARYCEENSKEYRAVLTDCFDKIKSSDASFETLFEDYKQFPKQTKRLFSFARSYFTAIQNSEQTGVASEVKQKRKISQALTDQQQTRPKQRKSKGRQQDQTIKTRNAKNNLFNNFALFLEFKKNFEDSQKMVNEQSVPFTQHSKKTLFLKPYDPAEKRNLSSEKALLKKRFLNTNQESDQQNSVFVPVQNPVQNLYPFQNTLQSEIEILDENQSHSNQSVNLDQMPIIKNPQSSMEESYHMQLKTTKPAVKIYQIGELLYRQLRGMYTAALSFTPLKSENVFDQIHRKSTANLASYTPNFFSECTNYQEIKVLAEKLKKLDAEQKPWRAFSLNVTRENYTQKNILHWGFQVYYFVFAEEMPLEGLSHLSIQEAKKQFLLAQQTLENGEKANLQDDFDRIEKINVRSVNPAKERPNRSFEDSSKEDSSQEEAQISMLNALSQTALQEVQKRVQDYEVDFSNLSEQLKSLSLDQKTEVSNSIDEVLKDVKKNNRHWSKIRFIVPSWVKQNELVMTSEPQKIEEDFRNQYDSPKRNLKKDAFCKLVKMQQAVQKQVHHHFQELNKKRDEELENMFIEQDALNSSHGGNQRLFTNKK